MAGLVLTAALAGCGDDGDVAPPETTSTSTTAPVQGDGRSPSDDSVGHDDPEADAGAAAGR